MSFEDAPTTFEEIQRHIQAKVTTSLKVRRQQKFEDLEDSEKIQMKLDIYDGFFRDLAILDAKAGALATSNAILAGFIAIVISQPREGSAGQSIDGVPFLLLISFIAAVLSLILTISVLYVRWSTTEELERRTLEGMVEEICRVRNGRTRRFRVALYLLVISLVIISVYVVEIHLVPGFLT